MSGAIKVATCGGVHRLLYIYYNAGDASRSFLVVGLPLSRYTSLFHAHGDGHVIRVAMTPLCVEDAELLVSG